MTGRAASRAATPTDWVPQSKPFWLMEIGCPAVDKGANQPNVFVDPKSSETALPYFSRGTRDDFMQRRFLRAFIEGLDPESDNYLAGANPLSEVYDAPHDRCGAHPRLLLGRAPVSGLSRTTPTCGATATTGASGIG